MLQIDNLTKNDFSHKNEQKKRNDQLVISTFQMYLYALGTQDSFMTNGRISLGSWFCEKEDIIFEVTRLSRSNGIICGRFSGILKRVLVNGTIESKRIENGFFDLSYTAVKVPNIVV